MTWLLDADVLSQPAKLQGDPHVIAWLRSERDRCYTSSIVVAQLAFWVRTKQGRQREQLQVWLSRFLESMQGRVHGFNVSVAHVWADWQHGLQTSGIKMPVEDSYIAATAIRYDLTIVTGNERHFRRPGLRVFNPFRDRR